MGSCPSFCMVSLLWSSSKVSYSLFNLSKSLCRVFNWTPQKYKNKTTVKTARFELMNSFVCVYTCVHCVCSTCVYMSHLQQGLFVCLFQGVRVALWHAIPALCLHPVELLLGFSQVYSTRFQSELQLHRVHSRFFQNENKLQQKIYLVLYIYILDICFSLLFINF